MSTPLTDETGAVIGTHGLRKALSWKDALAVGMVMPAGAIASYGYWTNSLGTWGVITLIGISTVIAVLQAFVFAELASMFPEKPGGVALFAHEAWKRYTNLAGPLAAFGSWFGWSVVLAINGITIGSLLQAQFFTGQTWSKTIDLKLVTITWGFPQVVATLVILGVWLLNVLGVRALAVSSWVLGTLLMIPLAFFILGPFLTGNFSTSDLHAHVTADGSAGFSLVLMLVWLYLMGWTTYGLEIVSTFTPEMHDPRRDFSRALRWVTVITAGSFVLMPLATGGAIGDSAVPEGGAPGPFYVAIAQKILGGNGAGFVILLLCFSLLLAMNSATADGGRVLYGMARDGLTLRWLGGLNHHRVPGRAMTLDVVVNVLFVFLVANPVGIYAIANLGYFVMIFFVLTGFVLLRRDRPDWPRPIRLGPAWPALASVLAVVTVVLAVVGAWRTDLTGYGTKKELVIAVLVPLLAVALWIYRHRVEEGHAIPWRDTSEPDPSYAAARTDDPGAG